MHHVKFYFSHRHQTHANLKRAGCTTRCTRVHALFPHVWQPPWQPSPLAIDGGFSSEVLSSSNHFNAYLCGRSIHAHSTKVTVIARYDQLVNLTGGFSAHSSLRLKWSPILTQSPGFCNVIRHLHWTVWFLFPSTCVLEIGSLRTRGNTLWTFLDMLFRFSWCNVDTFPLALGPSPVACALSAHMLLPSSSFVEIINY